MEIKKAMPEDFDAVRLFYYSLIDALEGTEYHPLWQKDIYPAQEDLRTAIQAGELYMGFADGRIAGAVVVNQKCNDEYQDVKWPTELTQSEFMVIHMLGIHRECSGTCVGENCC